MSIAQFFFTLQLEYMLNLQQQIIRICATINAGTSFTIHFIKNEKLIRIIITHNAYANTRKLQWKVTVEFYFAVQVIYKTEGYNCSQHNHILARCRN